MNTMALRYIEVPLTVRASGGEGGGGWYFQRILLSEIQTMFSQSDLVIDQFFVVSSSAVVVLSKDKLMNIQDFVFI